jgi:predicted nuclease of restriction endonuclease-like (RecB) superfamily
MTARDVEKTDKRTALRLSGYDGLLTEVVSLVEQARRVSARTVNAVMTATYWRIGRRIVEVEQAGEVRAEHGEEVAKHLADDLTDRFGRGFSLTNIKQFRQFYLTFPASGKGQTLSGQSQNRGRTIGQTPSAESTLQDTATRFPLPWSAYVRLLSVKNDYARRFYETEALRGGWSVRQLDRQIESQFYERTALSKNKAAMLTKGAMAMPDDAVTPEEEIRDPYVLEFLNLKDEYSESDLEEALVRYLEHFLMELGGDFAFVGRQKRLRIDDEWYRVDLLFFHAEYRMALPEEAVIAGELEKTRRFIEKRRATARKKTGTAGNQRCLPTGSSQSENKGLPGRQPHLLRPLHRKDGR